MWDHGALIGVTATYFAGLRLEPPRDPRHAARNVVEIHDRNKVIRMGVAAPLIHGTANFAAQATHLQGGCVVMPASRLLDPAELWRLVEAERVTNLAIVGDVFGRPLADELERAAEVGAPYDLGSVRVIQSSGVMWSAPVKDRLRTWLPEVVMVDALGHPKASTWPARSLGPTARPQQPGSGSAIAPCVHRGRPTGCARLG